MDVSNEERLTGVQLIEKVASLTELPQTLMEEELGRILEVSGHSPEALTLDQLREAMLAYLEVLDASCLEQCDSAPLELSVE